MTYYIIIRVGCLECGNDSNVIGIFTDEEIAIKTAEKYGYDGSDWIKGSGMTQLHKIEELNKDNDTETAVYKE